MKQNRKSFFKTLGLAGAGTLFNSNAWAGPSMAMSPENAGGVKRSLRLAHLTDIHVMPGKIPEYGMAKVLNEVNDLPDKVDIIVNGGDAIMNAVSFSSRQVKAQWDTFHRIVKDESNLPLYHCIGNHDIFSWAMPDRVHGDGKIWACDELELKRSYYSFSSGAWKFIVLDSIHGRKSIPGYYGKLDDEQFQWLERELQNTLADEHVCIISHIPILAICSLFDANALSHNTWKVPDNSLHADAKDLTDLFYRYKNVKACLSGHIHLIDYVNYLGIDFYCNGAVSGSWWKGDHKQFAPSFSVMNFYADGTTKRDIHYYQWKA